MKRYITLVDTHGLLAAIIPFDAEDHTYDGLQGAKLGSASMSAEDKSHILEAYGAALVDQQRQHVTYRWTADRGADLLEIDVVRFPEISVSAMLLSRVVPNESPEKKLTKRERQIVELSASDLSDADIAKKLKIAKSTVARHKQNVRSKLGAKEWTAAVVRYLGLELNDA